MDKVAIEAGIGLHEIHGIGEDIISCLTEGESGSKGLITVAIDKTLMV